MGLFCCVKRPGKRKRELRDCLRRGDKVRIGFDHYEIDPPSIYDTITLDDIYTIDHTDPHPSKKTSKVTPDPRSQ